MSDNVKLSESHVNQAKQYTQIEHRSIPKQIEYWSRIGKIAKENPDLTFYHDPSNHDCRFERIIRRISVRLMRVLVTLTFERIAKKLHKQ